jgi:hypothetical protein
VTDVDFRPGAETAVSYDGPDQYEVGEDVLNSAPRHSNHAREVVNPIYDSHLEGMDSEGGDVAFSEDALHDLALNRAFGSVFFDELGLAGLNQDESHPKETTQGQLYDNGPYFDGGREVSQTEFMVPKSSANGYDARFDEPRFDEHLNEPEGEERDEEDIPNPAGGWLSGRLSDRLNRLIDPDFDELENLDKDEGSLAMELLQDEAEPGEDPIALRSLRWLKRNVSSLKVTVSVQRSAPVHPSLKPRKYPEE